jgi:hypothetical protein
VDKAVETVGGLVSIRGLPKSSLQREVCVE